MLKTILSVTGKPGLFKLISSGKNMVIVESLSDKKRLPIYARDKVVSLGDIAMYTEGEEVALREVLIAIKKKENGGKSSVPANSKPEELHAFLESVLPSFDKERVYNADIKKLINWYNALIESGIDFELEEAAETETTEVAEAEAGAEKEAKPAAKEKKATAKPKASTPKATAKPINTKGAKPTGKTANRKAQ